MTRAGRRQAPRLPREGAGPGLARRFASIHRYNPVMLKVFRKAAGACLAPGGSVVAIGAFDGLHRGHAAVLAGVRDRARELSLVPAVVTFEPLPRAFFARGPMPRLSSLREKLHGFAGAGIELLLLLRFDAVLASMGAESFVRQVLVRRMGAREVRVGADFRFGHRRAGDVALLRALGVECGFDVCVVEPVAADDGERVSASRVRVALGAGDFELARRLLGRPFTIGGRIVHGNGLGRQLGYPTANVPLGKRVAPVAGIFAVRVHGIGDRPLPGVASLGVRPTIGGGGQPVLEAHLFDFDDDIYGRRIAVEFVAHLRDEAKFTGLDALVVQMDRDAAQARELLGVRSAHPRRPAPVPSRRKSGACG